MLDVILYTIDDRPHEGVGVPTLVARHPTVE